ncbi:MAG: hypothetical protein OEY17_08180 [Nitrosopumilus sp.]|nr:hypothetical protein [Nitrosopumilus sp.]MDH5659302.1 hypothetical protein [Nitrosopumilus sp.]
MVENKDNQDSFRIMEQICKKYFSEIENSVPHIQQVLFDFQNECYKTWKNTVNANMSLQKEFINNSKFVFPESFKTLVENLSEETVKYRSLCNKIIISAIESGKKNVKTWNDNADIFVDLNRKIMHYWLPLTKNESD